MKACLHMLKRMKVTIPGSMCKMENDNHEFKNDINGLNGLNTDRKDYTKTTEVRKICEYLGKWYNRVYNKETLGFNYYEYKKSRKYVCFLSRNLIMQVSADKFKMYSKKYDSHSALDAKYSEFDGNTIMIVSEKKCKFRPQVGFLQRCLDTLRTPFVMLDNAKGLIEKITSKASKLLFLDILSLLLNLRDGFLTATKIVSVLLQLYTIHTRYVDLMSPAPRLYVPQAGTTVTDLLLGFSMLGLPVDVLNAIKTFTSLTGKRVFESDLFMEMAEKLFNSLTVMIKWIANPLCEVRLLSVETEELLLDMLTKMGTSIFMHKDIKQVCDIYTKYVSNPQLLFDPTFRQEIMTKYNELKANSAFLSYVQNGNNKYFMTTWSLFEANVVKSCQAFDTSGRDEPICFVFEGEAGSGKSCIMNTFVALLKEKGMTTICHSVPAAEDGKDFYDDYENQEVFVMDDVGQQGKSQWRYLINYVSPVKYPLPCATASKKNTKFFNSKIILCTTNHFRDLGGFTSSDCISEPEALYRRAHVINVTRGASDHFSQNFSYYKFDHIHTKTWENRFINHNAVNVPNNLPPNFTTADAARSDNTQRALKWIYRVFLHIVESEKRNNNQMSVPVSDLRDILANAANDEFVDTVEDFAPQSDSYDSNFTQGNFYFMKYVIRAMMPNSLLTWRFNARNERVFMRTDYNGYERPVVYTGDDKLAIGYYDHSLMENSYIYYTMICKEYVKYYFDQVCGYMQDCLPTIVNFMSTLSNVVGSAAKTVYDVLLSNPFLTQFLVYIFAWYIAFCFFGEEEVDRLPTPEFTKDTVRNMTSYVKDGFEPQSDKIHTQHGEWIENLQRFCKTMVIRHPKDVTRDEHTQCVVSGKRILLPAHIDIGTKFVDLYHTWNHYKEGHVEIENVQLRLIKKYVLSDLAVYEIKNTIPLYKTNRSVFPEAIANSRYWYLINSAGHLPVLCDKDIVRNEDRVQYSTVHGKFDHPEGSGYYTPYTTSGACGTILAAPGAGIVGFHVAGNPTIGFCVSPPEYVKKEIRDLMMAAPAADNFELDDKIIPNFSGVRLRYEGKVEQMRAMDETSFRPSPLHVEVCEPMEALIATIEERPMMFTETPIEKIDVKSPPNFRSKGTPAQTLKYLSKKTFMKQGRITDDEMEFIKKCLRSIMIKFDDLNDNEVAFGGEFVPPLNKDSSNGYGCLKSKSEYFDFEKKIIKPAAYELIERIRNNAKNKKYDYNDFMCRETFKDELRKSTKVDEPRTFRVMPLGHIWWTKKIFGKLLKHFKNSRMQTGISVGFNPYIDADALAKKLMLCKITGDADFGKWDGTILAILILVIFSVFEEYYEGDYDYMLEWLANTIATSFVLVNDEILATTHGLPSGTWLTLLLNCLLNKCLTALVIYRYKPDPTVDDFLGVVDFVTGDDKVFGADETLAPYFNLLNIKAVAESLGMDCTNGDKSKITKNSQEFDKLTYVKRHFRKHPVLQRYVGCLSMDTILNTLQWIDTNTTDTHEAMLGKMRSMQIEGYLHSPALFNELTRIFINKYPFDAFFDEQRVLRILSDPEGYDHVLNMQNKNFNH